VCFVARMYVLVSMFKVVELVVSGSATVGHHF
jgi:hypothetical protein